MKQFILSILLTIAGLGLASSCGKKEALVTEKTEKPAEFTFLTTQDIHFRLQLENVGDVHLKGSMPDKTVFQIHRSATARGRSRAAELMDRIAMVPAMEKDGLLKFQPKYPEVRAGERVRSDVTVLVPLNQRIPVSLALSGGSLEAVGMKAELRARTVGRCDVALRAFQGVFDLELEAGDVVAGTTLEGGRIRLREGRVLITQRLKEPMDDVVVEVESGEVSVEVLQGFTGRIRLEAPEVRNSTRIKLADSADGRGILVRVKKGSAHLSSELY